MAKIDFGGVVEEVVTREEFPLEKARQVLSAEVVAVLGYGVQGPAQALNMRDNGINVIVGGDPERKRSWEKALKDGWEPGKTLFPFEEAVDRGTIVQYLVSDAAQMGLWPRLKPHLKEGPGCGGEPWRQWPKCTPSNGTVLGFHFWESREMELMHWNNK